MWGEGGECPAVWMCARKMKIDRFGLKGRVDVVDSLVNRAPPERYDFRISCDFLPRSDYKKKKEMPKKDNGLVGADCRDRLCTSREWR